MTVSTIWREEVGDGQSRDVVAPGADEASRCIVHIEDAAVRPGHADEVGAVLRQSDEAVALFLARAQVGDIAGHRQNAAGRPSGPVIGLTATCHHFGVLR
jgi:hypothetical protein